MTVIRHYVMIAKPEAGKGFPATLFALSGELQKLEGFQGFTLAQDAEQPLRFVFQEMWVSIDAHKAGGAALPKAALAPVMAALAEPPQGSYLTVLPL